MDRDAAKRLAHVELDDRSIVPRGADLDNDREVALRDLVAESSFRLCEDDSGPYRLRVGVEENRLVMDVRDSAGTPLRKFILALKPFQRFIKDYFTLCESYYSAVKQASAAQIEAIDMGRRGLHDEAASFLQDRLLGKVEMDHATARRLFTLISVLHIRM